MKFEKVSYEAFNGDMIRCGFHPEDIMDAYNSIEIPKRKTKHSAGYSQERSRIQGFKHKMDEEMERILKELDEKFHEEEDQE